MQKTKTYCYCETGHVAVTLRIPHDFPEYGVENIIDFYRNTGRVFDPSDAKQVYAKLIQVEADILEELSKPSLVDYWRRDLGSLLYKMSRIHSGCQTPNSGWSDRCQINYTIRELTGCVHVQFFSTPSADPVPSTPSTASENNW